MMNRSISIPKLADDIRQIYAVDPTHAEPAIETYLNSRWKTLSVEERITLLKKLVSEFNDSLSNRAFDSVIEDQVITELFSLVLGGRISKLDLSSQELLPRLAESLNTIFNKLNQIVGLINSTFNSESKGDETIRRVIGGHLEGEDQLKSLESYLGQINKAFLVTQEAFKFAVKKIVAAMLRELDPDMISKNMESGLKFGPLRKAEIFEIYENKYKICQKWFQSGRFMADFLREFEKKCQQKPL
jgi:hypothetical protein